MGVCLPPKLASPNRTLLARLAGLYSRRGRLTSLIHSPTRADERAKIQNWLVDHHDWLRHAAEMKPLLRERQQLPIAKYRQTVVDAVRQNPVVVLQGETGCGKTTQVPQYLLEDMISRGVGADAAIICTQPRRVSAVSIARRVAEERGDEIGSAVGFAVRGETIRSEDTRLLFCTTGVLLRQLAAEPDLSGVSHIIVDEVHERGMLTDFLLIQLRQLVESGRAPKLVLMSATLDASQFAAYFGGCPVLKIPGRVYPVEELHLEAVVRQTGWQSDRENYPVRGWQNSQMARDVPPEVMDACRMLSADELDFDLVAHVVLHIHETQPHGAILVFLTGQAEIEKVQHRLQKAAEDILALPLHGNQPPEQQCRVFAPAPPGMRKVVLATNVAETSITVNDVSYVVDSGKVKERRWNSRNSLATLREVQISQANALQRQGRAGRVRPGVCYKLWPSNLQLDRQQTPELVRSPLEELVLQSCLLGVESPLDFLSQAMNPPSGPAVQQAVASLQTLGALLCSQDGSVVLTPLGFHLATLPVDPRLGKMLLFACCFGIEDPMLTVAARMGSRPPFYVPREKQREVSFIHKMVFGDDRSDQLATARAYRMWREKRGTDGERAFLERHHVAPAAMRELAHLRRQLFDHLTASGWLEQSPSDLGLELGEDWGAVSKELARGIIAAGLWPNVARGYRVHSSRKIYERLHIGELEEVHMHPSSVNANVAGTESQDCLYVFTEKVETSRVFLRESTKVTPAALLLFGPQSLPAEAEVEHRGYVLLGHHRIAVRDYSSLYRLKSDLDLMLQLRCMRPRARERSADRTVQVVAEALRNPDEHARLLPVHG